MAKLLSGSLGGLGQTLAMTVDVSRVYTGEAQPAATAGFDLSGTWTGTVAFEATIDDLNWFPAAAWPQLTSGFIGSFVNTTTGPGRFFVKALGYSQVRVRMSAYTSGSAQVAGDLTADQVTPLAMLRELMILTELIGQGLNIPVDVQSEYRSDPVYP